MSRAGVVVQPLPPARIVAVLPAGHSLEARCELTLADLAGERLVLPSPQSYLRYQIDDAFTRQGIVPLVVAETPTSPLVCALAAEGAGIGLVSAWTPAPHGDTRLVQRPLTELLQSQYACLRPEGAVGMALADEFQELLTGQMQLIA